MAELASDSLPFKTTLLLPLRLETVYNKSEAKIKLASTETDGFLHNCFYHCAGTLTGGFPISDTLSPHRTCSPQSSTAH